jgi:hypothetical protein
MPKIERTILAFCFAPLLAPLAYIASGTVIAGGKIPSFDDFIALLANTWTYAVSTGYLGLLVMGIPTLVVLGRYGVLRLHWVVAAAALQGGVVTLILITFLFGVDEIRPPFSDLVSLLIPGSITAVTIAVVFWYVSGHNWPLNRTRKSAAPLS